MRYDVYVDLTRQLTDEEKSAVGNALDAIVPGSGYVGRKKPRTTTTKCIFSIEALTDTDARTQAAQYADRIFREAGLDAEKYAIELHEAKSYRRVGTA